MRRRLLSNEALLATLAVVISLVLLSHAGAAQASETQAKALDLVSHSYPCRQEGEGAPPLTNHGGDLAFWRDTAVVACGADDARLENDGFVLMDISDPAHPRQIGAFACVASASDVAVWRDLVFMAVDRNSDGLETDPANDPNVLPGPETMRNAPDPDPCDANVRGRDLQNPNVTFQGVRIVSIADPASPQKIKSVRLNNIGAHNLTVVPELDHVGEVGDPEPRLIVYAPSPGDPLQAVVVPLDQPEASIVRSVQPDVPVPRDCHDVSVFLPRGLVACNSVPTIIAGDTYLWDIRDDIGDSMDDGASVLTPVQLAATPPVTPPPFPATHKRDHSSAYSWDGKTLVVTDEQNQGQPTNSCISAVTPEQGALWFYDISDPRDPELVASMPPQALVGNGWCYPKQVSVVPLPDGREVLTVSWVGGGTTIVDFSGVNDGTAPREIGRYVVVDQAGTDKSTAWASYWYNGHIYVNNAAFGNFGACCLGTDKRGLEVMRPSPALGLDDAVRLRRYNFATQECVAQRGLAPCQ